MVTWFSGLQKEITDFIIGSKIRTKLEAIAVEMEAQDFQIYRAIKKAIPISVYRAFDFNLLAAVRAQGIITFSAAVAPGTNILIPAGTQVATVGTSLEPERVYYTTANVTLVAGHTTVNAGVLAVLAGAGGNTGPATVTVLKTTISGLSTVTNAANIAGGTDVETEEGRRLRFLEFILTITRGTNAALEYAAKTAYLTDNNGVVSERVLQSVTTGPPTSGAAGCATVYIFNGVDGASNNLITKAQNIIDGYTDNTGTVIAGYKAAGVVVTVAEATTVEQDVTVAITKYTGFSSTVIQASAETIIATYLSQFKIGETLIYNELVERLMGIAGVYNVDITTPSADVTVNPNEVFIQGDITVTVT
jgi:uncharacterized phage protein gp47/JayE